jgi:hypothetical protein
VLAGESDFEATALFDQIYVDLGELDRVVRAGLLDHQQVGLSELVAEHPLDHGLTELIGYLSLTDPAYDVVFDSDRREQVGWSTADVERVADLPAVSYVRAPEMGGGR